jgi:hypothetical protein
MPGQAAQIIAPPSSRAHQLNAANWKQENIEKTGDGKEKACSVAPANLPVIDNVLLRAALGCIVTATRTTRRLPCSMTTNT